MSENMDPNYVDASTLDDLSVKPEPSFDSGLNYGAPLNTVPSVQQPAPQPVPHQELEAPVGMGSWIGMLFLELIPCVNIIMLFVWAFSGSFKKSQSNYAKAKLIVNFAYAVLVTAAYVFLAAAYAKDYLDIITELY